MTWMLWLGVGVAAWIAISLVLGLVLGELFRQGAWGEGRGSVVPLDRYRSQRRAA
jgi:hypothetical protein